MCPTSEELSAYYDGQLTPERARRIQWHVRWCSSCAGELADLRMLSEWLAQADRREPPTEMLGRLRAYARSLAEQEGSATIGNLLRLGRVLSGLAAAVLVFGALRLYFGPHAAGTAAPTSPQAAQTAQAPPADDWESIVVAADPRGGAADGTAYASSGAAGTAGAAGDSPLVDWVVSGLSDPR